MAARNSADSRKTGAGEEVRNLSPLKGGKEEELVFLDGSAQGCAELVQSQRQSLTVRRIGNMVGKK